ncbi:hypothetical protein EMCRGX_G011878 [Ephydatia muelleri]
MDDAMFAVASQQTLSLFITEEQLVLEQAAVVCCLALVTCECHWLCCTTLLSELVEMALFSSSAACLSSSGQQRSIAFDAGLTCDGSSSEQQGQLTAPDAAMYSTRVWTRDQVAVWLHKSAVQYRLRSSNPERFPMNGKALVLMTKDMFLYRMPEGGGFLYEDIQFRLQKLFTDSLDEATRDALLQITQS